MIALFFVAASVAGGSPAQCEKPARVQDETVRNAVGHRIAPGQRIVTGIDRAKDGNPQATAYVRSASQWLAYELGDSLEIISVYRMKNDRLLILGFHTAEGPGDAFEGLLFDPHGRRLACPRIAFPDALNWNEKTRAREWQNEYLSLDSIAFTADGKGTIIASGKIDEVGAQIHVAYRYKSRDGGRTWGKPQRLHPR